jgi:hypothetical protein
MNIIEINKQATYDLQDEFGNWIGHGFDKEKFAELVAAHEREECAKLCEDMKPFGLEIALQKATIEDCVAAIRARSKA